MIVLILSLTSISALALDNLKLGLTFSKCQNTMLKSMRTTLSLILCTDLKFCSRTIAKIFL